MVPDRIVRVTDIQLSGLTQRLQLRAAFAVWTPLVEFSFFKIAPQAPPVISNSAKPMR
jgi:hypothetical protein